MDSRAPTHQHEPHAPSTPKRGRPVVSMSTSAESTPIPAVQPDRALVSADVLALQRSVGNRAVARRLGAGAVPSLQRMLLWADGRHKALDPQAAAPPDHTLRYVPARRDTVWIRNADLAAYPLPHLDPASAPAPGAPVPAAREIPETNVKKPWKKSQFKTIYELQDGSIMSVRVDGNAVLTQGEYDALLKVELSGLRTPDPELVTYQGKQAIRMRKVEGVFVDINKIQDRDNTLVYKLMVSALTTGKVDDSEMGLARLMGNKELHHRGAPREAVERLKAELAAVLTAGEKVSINDLQAVVGKDGRLTIIDPQWAGDPKQLGADIRMVSEAYVRVFTTLQQFGGTWKPSVQPPANK